MSLFLVVVSRAQRKFSDSQIISAAMGGAKRCCNLPVHHKGLSMTFFSNKGAKLKHNRFMPKFYLTLNPSEMETENPRELMLCLGVVKNAYFGEI